ncbi:MAG: cation transporter [Bacteroidia bacterium]|nr:cation transporter [Bacteroidia bacterium]
MNKVKYKTNINCGNCIKSVTPALNSLDNLDTWKVDTVNPDKILEVVLDDDNKQVVIEAVKKMGFEIEEISF